MYRSSTRPTPSCKPSQNSALTSSHPLRLTLLNPSGCHRLFHNSCNRVRTSSTNRSTLNRLSSISLSRMSRIRSCFRLIFPVHCLFRIDRNSFQSHQPLLDYVTWTHTSSFHLSSIIMIEKDTSSPTFRCTLKNIIIWSCPRRVSTDFEIVTWVV
jgi:hypothetical protein